MNSNQVNWLADGPFYTMHCTSCSVAECANILMRSVNYEIPAVKRQIAKAQQLQKVPVTHQLHWSCLSADEGHGVLCNTFQIHLHQFMLRFPILYHFYSQLPLPSIMLLLFWKRFVSPEALNTLQWHSLVHDIALFCTQPSTSTTLGGTYSSM